MSEDGSSASASDANMRDEQEDQEAGSDPESSASDASVSDEEENEDSDSDSSSPPALRPVKSFKAAIERLQQTNPPVQFLRIKFPRRDIEPDRGLWFPRFISALQRHENIEQITFVTTRFNEDDGNHGAEAANGGIDDVDRIIVDDDGALPSEDLDRLFGTVLPNHPTLTMFSFERCFLPCRYVRLLVSALPAADDWGWPKAGCVFLETELDLPSIEAISGAVRRSAFWRLSLHDSGMTSPKCRLITGAAAECHGLESLAVVERGENGGTWNIDEEAFAPGSISKVFIEECLWFGGASWTDEGAAEFFGQLRTNDRQENASIYDLSVDQTRYPVELLSTYNFIRLHLYPHPAAEWDPRLRQATRQARRAWKVRAHLEPTNYHLTVRALWPRVLHRVCSYPTLVYRFLRRSNVAALADQLRPASSKKSRFNGAPAKRSQRIRSRMA